MDDYEKRRALAKRREEMRAETKKEVLAIFALSGFEVRHVWELANGYWPDSPDYDDCRRPWWLVLTERGPIRIGRRKRVIDIWWDATDMRGIVTADDVTKGDSMVHAWTPEKAVEYLRVLRTVVVAAP